MRGFFKQTVYSLTLFCILVLTGLGNTVKAETVVTAVMNAPLKSVDPVITTAYIMRDFGFMIYDTLLAEDSDGNIQPQMVKGWDLSNDGLTYTFRLHDNLQWHNGT